MGTKTGRGQGKAKAKAVAKAKLRVKYLAKPGARISNDDARIVGPIIERIAKSSGGKATPQAVLGAARDPSSPLHRFFEWDNNKAAEAYRVEQASYLIRSIEVQYTGKKEDRVRAFHVVTSDGSKGYAPLPTILERPDLTRQLIQRARDEQASWARRYQSIRHAAEVAGIFDALEHSGIIESSPLANAAE